MFRVSLSNLSITTEINQIEGKGEKRAAALKDSAEQLERDHKDVISFVDESQKKRKDYEEREK